MEKFLDGVLVPNGSVWEYSLKDGCEFDVPNALLRKKSQWIGALMDHYYVFDDETGEFTDEIEEKSYDENGHFEYYTDQCDYDNESGEFTDEIEEKSYDENGHFEYYADECDYSIPVVIDNWIDAFFLVMVSYFSIRKVKYSDVF